MQLVGKCCLSYEYVGDQHRDPCFLGMQLVIQCWHSFVRDQHQSVCFRWMQLVGKCCLSLRGGGRGESKVDGCWEDLQGSIRDVHCILKGKTPDIALGSICADKYTLRNEYSFINYYKIDKL